MWSSPLRSSTPDGGLRLVRSGDSVRRPDLRFYQWISRRRQLDRHRRFDARAVAECRGRVGGILEFRGGVRVRHRDCKNRRQRPHRPQRRRFDGSARRPDRGDRLGSRHVVARPAYLLVARTDRRVRGSRGGESGILGDHRQRLDQDAHLHRGGTGDGVRARAGADRGALLDPAPIAALLVSSQALFVNFPIQAFHLTDPNQIPPWVIVAAGAAIGLGTMAGGWRIVKTMGQRITKLTPFGGFCAEPAGAITLFVSSHFGIPVSTTHTITGAITGVAAVQRFAAVRWGVAGRIVWAWV